MDNVLAFTTDLGMPLQMVTTRGREYSDDIELSDSSKIRICIEQQVPDELVTICVFDQNGSLIEKATICRGGVQIFRSIGLLVCVTTDKIF